MESHMKIVSVNQTKVTRFPFLTRLSFPMQQRVSPSSLFLFLSLFFYDSSKNFSQRKSLKKKETRKRGVERRKGKTRGLCKWIELGFPVSLLSFAEPTTRNPLLLRIPQIETLKGVLQTVELRGRKERAGGKSPCYSLHKIDAEEKVTQRE